MNSGVGVVPRDDGVEARVEVGVREDRVMRDAVPELAQSRDRTLALGGSEVVEDRARHQEPRRPRIFLGLRFGDGECRRERQVDVVTEDQIARFRCTVEPGPPVAARLPRAQQFAVVRE